MDPTEFETLFAATSTLPELPGWTTRLLKGERGERGERADTYLLLFEIDSVETRDRYYPAEGQESDESKRYDEEHPDAPAAWERLRSCVSDIDTVTDYLAVGD